MTKSKLSNNFQKRHFKVAIVGGGLTGSLMTYILIKSKIVTKKSLCWIKPKTKSNHDDRVSFYNYKNFQILIKFGLKMFLNKQEINNVNKIEILNEKQKRPLTFEDNENLGVICKNAVVQKFFSTESKNVTIINSKVINSSSDEYQRTLMLESGDIITSHIVLAADGTNSSLRELSKIKFFKHELDHIAFNGYLNANVTSDNIARQAFLKEGPVGLLPMKDKTNNMNFVWSVNKEFAKKFKSDEKVLKFLITKLNKLYKKYNIIFSKTNHNQLSSKTYKWPLRLIYVPKPIANRIALIGDASHTIHPLAGQGFNLSLEDCFAMLDILKNSFETGKDFGQYENLEKYAFQRKNRTKFMTLSTTSIFYSFTNNSYLLNAFLSLGMENIEKTKLKNIFKNFASGF